MFKHTNAMKTLDITQIDLSTAVVVSEDQIKNRLLRIDLDTYAFTVPWQDQAVLAFQSRTFSALLHWMGTPIIDFAVFRLQCLENQDNRQITEVRVLGETGLAYKYDSRGCVEQLTALEEINMQPEGVYEPAKKWGIDPVYPYDRILVSYPLDQKLTRYLEDGSPKDVLDHLWSEFSRMRRKTGPKSVHDVQSEFGAFCVVESFCGRFIFVSTVEGFFVADTSSEDEDL